jgi:hypothetical protein
MKIRSPQARTAATDSLFAIFVTALVGWTLLESLIIQHQFGIVVHVLAFVPAVSLATLALYRYRLHWPATTSLDQPDLMRQAAAAVLLFLVGTGVPVLVSAGLSVLIPPVAIAAAFVPWRKLTICRDRFFLSTAAIVSGTAIGLLMFKLPASPFMPLLAAWGLWLIAGAFQIRVLVVFGDDKTRMPVAGF